MNNNKIPLLKAKEQKDYEFIFETMDHNMKTRYGTSYYLSREKELFLLVVDDDKYEEAKEHALLFIKDPSCFYMTPKYGKELVEIEDDIINDFRFISKNGEEELIRP